MIIPFSWWTPFRDSPSPRDGVLSLAWDTVHSALTGRNPGLTLQSLLPPFLMVFQLVPQKHCSISTTTHLSVPLPRTPALFYPFSQAISCVSSSLRRYRSFPATVHLCVSSRQHMPDTSEACRGHPAGLNGDLGDFNDLRAAVQFLHHFKHPGRSLPRFQSFIKYEITGD